MAKQFKVKAGWKVKNVVDGWNHYSKFPVGNDNDLSKTTYCRGVIAKLANDVPGFPVNEDGITSEEFGGIFRTDARLFFPKYSDDKSKILWEEKTTEDSNVQVWNETFYDLKEGEEVWVYEQGNEWIVTSPVRPTDIYFTLNEDLFADSTASAEVAWGTENIFAAPEYIEVGQHIPAGTSGFGVRGNNGYYAITFNTCPEADGTGE